MPILRLAGKALRRRRPVNSALDSAANSHAVNSARRNGYQSSGPRLSERFVTQSGFAREPAVLRFANATQRARNSLPRDTPQPRLGVCALSSSNKRPPCGCRRGVGQSSRPAFHIRELRNCSLGTGTVRPGRRAVGSTHGTTSSSCHARLATVSPLFGCSTLGRRACLASKALSNPSFKRSANGWPPCPRGAVCLSSASRARRPSVVARLTLR